jgi:hypothetical protein
MFTTIFRKSHLKFKVCGYYSNNDILEYIMHFRTAWNDYFPETSPTNTNNSQTCTSRQNPSGTSVYVSNCLFRSITSSNVGGALCCTSAMRFLVESTSFFSCKTSSKFGAVYFQNDDSQSVLYEVCGYDCCTTNSNGYQFAYIRVGNVTSNKNYANYSSISRCVNENSNADCILGLCFGKTFCPSVNLSLNKCGYHSAIACWPTSDSNYVASSLKYSSFTDNNAISNNCILLNRGGAKSEIKSCNILRNTQGSLGSYGTIYSNENLMIYDSCILENTATNIFYQHSSSYTTTLSNCTVDKTTYNQNLVTQNAVSKSFILALNHMSTENCHAGYDSAGYLTPNIQTPSRSKKQIFCYTCKNFLYHPHLRIDLKGL